MSPCKHNGGQHTLEYTGVFHIVTNHPNYMGFLLCSEQRCTTCQAKGWEEVNLTGQEYLWYSTTKRLLKEEGAGSISLYIGHIELGGNLPKDIHLTRERYVEIMKLAHHHYILKLFASSETVRKYSK